MATAAVDRLRNVLRKSPFSEHSKRRTMFKRLMPVISTLKYSIMSFKYEAKRVDWPLLVGERTWEFDAKRENLCAMIDQIMLDLNNLTTMLAADRRLPFENLLDQIRSYKIRMVAAMDERNVLDLRRLGDFEGVETESEALVFNNVLSALEGLMF